MSRATAKPAKGSAAKATRSRRSAIERAETKAKNAAKERDGFRCRRCLRQRIWWDDMRSMFVMVVEAAHIHDKGMGGDHGTRSGKASDYVTLCTDCHRGPRSVHSGHLRIEAGPDGGDGPVRFVRQLPGKRTI